MVSGIRAKRRGKLLVVEDLALIQGGGQEGSTVASLCFESVAPSCGWGQGFQESLLE